jgi:hypothetical protein
MKIVHNWKTKAKTLNATQEKVLVVVMMFVAMVALVAMARLIITMMFIEIMRKFSKSF